jgi:outer membrane receptor protein involved in Fe transport
VYQPDSDNVWLGGLSASLDWYNIEIDDMIALESAPSVYNKCLGMDTNPTGSATHPDCQKIIRNPVSGGAQFTDVTFLNGGKAQVEGVDLQTNWSAALSEVGIDLPGVFGVDFTISTLLTLDTQASPTQPVIDWVGSLGPSPGTSFNNGSYEYRTFTNFSYSLDNWNFSLRWRHLPGAVNGQQPVAGNNRIAFLPTDSYDVFDFSGTWAINENYLLRFGIENLADSEPNITGAADNYQGNIPVTRNRTSPVPRTTTRATSRPRARARPRQGFTMCSDAVTTSASARTSELALSGTPLPVVICGEHGLAAFF